MPTWSHILVEFKHASPDEVRRKYLAQLAALTGRNVIIYATDWMQGTVPPGFVSINDEDLCGFMECVHGLNGPSLDLILHSPGGSGSAAEAIVTYLRSKFEHIRVIVPHMAKSAATMIACASDTIVMGKHSFLGPTDPQLFLQSKEGIRVVPAEAILEEFERAKKECQDPKSIGAWIPILNQYYPGLLTQCKNAGELSQQLVREWLESYMFKNDQKQKANAQDIAKWLESHGDHKDHSRPFSRDLLSQKGLNIQLMEDVQEEQDAFLSVFHATMHTFNMTPAVKIIENHLGKAYLKQLSTTGIPVQIPVPVKPITPPNDPAQATKQVESA